MTEHTWEQHTNCERIHCPICDGGLAVCTVCGGGEAELPPHCPGIKMAGEQKDAVMAGDLDFIDGNWKEFP